MNLQRIQIIGRAVVGWTVIWLSFASSALASLTAQRVFFDGEYIPGIPIKITIMVTPELNQEFTVVENFPPDWEVLAVSKGGERTGNQIIWKQTPKAKGTITLYYKIIPPTTASENVIFQGTINNQNINGSSTLNRGSLKPVGIFENHIDMWYASAFNKAEFDESTEVYRITAGLTSDLVYGIHFLYSEVYGDALIETFTQGENPKEQTYAMVGLVIYDSLDDDSIWFCTEMKLSGDCWVAWGKNIPYTFAQLYTNYYLSNGGMRLVREQNKFSAYFYNIISEDWKFACETKLNMTDPVYIGLWAHCGYGDATVGIFREVKLEYSPKPTSIENWMLHP